MSMNHERVLILDFGSQYTQLIARRVRELNVYCEIHRPDLSAAQLKDWGAKGVILSGGPASVEAPGAPMVDPAVFELGVPVLGVCYGLQLMAKLLGGRVAKSDHREFGPATVTVTEATGPFKRLKKGAATEVWMSHGDRVEELPKGFHAIGSSPGSKLAAIAHEGRPLFGLQFHPEVVHTLEGKDMLAGFLFDACGLSGNWSMRGFVNEAVDTIRAKVKDGRVICGLSGGVDSSVAAMLLHRAIGDHLQCIFVDNGLLRAGEREQVEETFAGRFHVPLKVVDARQRFLTKLDGVIDPEKKRKIIGYEFIAVFEEAAKTCRAPTSSRRARCTPTSSSRSRRRGRRPPSRATTTSAGCPRR